MLSGPVGKIAKGWKIVDFLSFLFTFLKERRALPFLMRILSSKFYRITDRVDQGTLIEGESTVDLLELCSTTIDQWFKNYLLSCKTRYLN
jgi:hypothetical protein